MTLEQWVQFSLAGCAGMSIFVCIVLAADRVKGLSMQLLTSPLAAALSVLAMLLPWIRPLPPLDWKGVAAMVVIAILMAVDCIKAK